MIVMNFMMYLWILLHLTLIATQFDHQTAGGLVNLIPFATIVRCTRRGGEPFIVNILGNLAAFVPVGFLVPLLRPSASFWLVFLCGASLSFAIEALQFASARRVADVDDVTLNALGALIGLALLRITQHLFKRQSRRPA
jgi:glycopeptide antibiotics resistance protein